jgi:nucleoside 2-deoxyribosyltransferase
MMIRVYTASKLRHGAMWRAYADDRVHFHARWLVHNLHGTQADPERATEFWIEDEHDVRCADAVIVYAEEEDKLRGALVEAGMAVAYGIPVIVIGSHPDYGTWQYHPGVARADTLEQAIDYLSDYCQPGRRRKSCPFT